MSNFFTCQEVTIKNTVTNEYSKGYVKHISKYDSVHIVTRKGEIFVVNASGHETNGDRIVFA